MKSIVITGSTRGIGFGLADAFLALDCQVTISGRARASVDQATAALAARHAAGRIFGFPCDVTHIEELQALWEAACARFGAVDIWINNAGISNRRSDYWNLSPEGVRGCDRDECDRFDVRLQRGAARHARPGARRPV